MKQRTFLRHAGVYAGGTILLNACNLLLLPLYLRCLRPDEYGTIDWLRSVGEVVLICLLFGGLKQALLSFHGQSTKSTDQRGAIASALLLGGGVSTCAVVLLLLFGRELARALRFPDVTLLQTMIVVVLLEAMSGLLMTSCQARLESGLFTSVTILQFFLRVGLSILFVVSLTWGIWGLVAASAITAGTTTFFLLMRECMIGGLRPHWPTVAGMCWFALPFVPGGLGFFLLHSGDRFFLREYGGEFALGLYALGYKLAFSVSQLSRTPLYMVWNTQMHQVASQPDAAMVFGRAFSRIVGAYLAVGLALCLVADELVIFLGKQEYAAASAVIPTVVVAYGLLTMADLMDAAFYVSRKTAWKTPITMISTAAIVGFYALLIPWYGALGAAWATLGGFAVHLLLTWRVSQRVFFVHFEWGRLAGAAGLAVLAWVISRFLPSSWWGVGMKAALGPAWLAAVWWAGIISPVEKRHLSELFGKWRAARVAENNDKLPVAA